MNKPATWIELRFDRVGDDLRLSARGSRFEQPDPRSLDLTRDKFDQFAASVEHAALHGQPLRRTVLDVARAIQKAVLDGAVGNLFAKLGEAAGGPLLVRFIVPKDAHDLKRVPWEALCNADEALGFWGTSPQVLPVRGVTSGGAWDPREVRGAVRVLAIAPTGNAGLDNLKQALAERIKTGEMEWLDPICGENAQIKHLSQQLRLRPAPHIVHFLGHGGIVGDLPSLRLADEDDEEKWLPAETFAKYLQANFGNLRLVVLEACRGAKSTMFGSAAEILARAGADAVVAHLWPIRADVAQTFSTELYRALTADGVRGDVAMAVNAARLSVLSIHEQSAETHSPVLFLRGPDGNIFNFDQRKVTRPQASVSISAGERVVPPALERIVKEPFSLVLGDRWKDDREALDAFRSKLRDELEKSATPPPPGLPMGTLAQWFALHRGGELLDQEFQEAFDVEMEGPAIVTAMARLLCPGVHTTLLRNPWLEHSLAEQQPERKIYVIQPNDAGAIIVRYKAGAKKKWERVSAAPDDFDDKQDILVLRPYRGHTSHKKFARPLLTEDDYFLRLREVWSGNAMPPHLAEILGGALSRRPALLVGLSMLTANHRMLLHTLYSMGLPRGSLAVVDKDDHEREMWEKGAGLPGKDETFKVIETSSAMLSAALMAMRSGQ